MRSLKGALILRTAVGAAAILIAAGVLLYALVRAGLVKQFDALLIDKARFLSAITEQKAGQVNLEFDELELSDFGSAEERAFVQVWLADGTSVYRSPTLREADLEHFAGTFDAPAYRWVELPDGRPGRAVGFTFAPREKGGGEPQAQGQELDSTAQNHRAYEAATGAQLIISEFMASNKNVLADEDGEYSDWIELHNVSQAAVDLAGWHLTDRVDTPGWRFPQVTIQPGQFLVLFASGKDRRDASSPLHAHFKLDADGEYLALVRPDGSTVESAYKPKFPRQVANGSYGLSSALAAPGYFRRPTPGQPNGDDQTDVPPAPIAGQITLVMARSTTSIDGTLAQLKGLLVLVGTATIPILIGTLWLAVRRSLRSLERLAAQISRLRERDLSQRIDVPGSPSELMPVIERLNGLLVQLQAAFERERGFSADVAHELRTPVAGLLMKMDLALSQARQPQEYQKLIADCRTIALQMQRMVENLLALSHLEGGRIELCPEPVVVNRLIRDLWEPFAEIADERRIRVNWSLEPHAQMVTDKALLQVAMRNILENAITYVDSDGYVNIASRTENSSVTLRVCNSGSLLTPDDLAHVFERFWRNDKARTCAGGHCGLGLSLTSRLVESLGGSVAVLSSQAGEFEITVTLPTAQ